MEHQPCAGQIVTCQGEEKRNVSYNCGFDNTEKVLFRKGQEYFRKEILCSCNAKLVLSGFFSI